MERYVVLPRLIPIDGGQLFVYGDRGVAFGDLNISQSLLSALGVDRLERARNPVARVKGLAGSVARRALALRRLVIGVLQDGGELFVSFDVHMAILLD